MTRTLTGLAFCAGFVALTLAACAAREAFIDANDIQQRLDKFDHLYAVIRKTDPPIRQVIPMFDDVYRKQFTMLQTGQQLARMKDSNVAELFNVAYGAQFMTDESKYIHDMELDLKQLERRGVASSVQYNQMYGALIGSRMFARAALLRERHRAMAMPPVPSLHDLSSDGKTGPTVMALSPTGRTLVRKNFDLREPAQIVIVASPLCHFAQFSLHDIQSDPRIGRVFAAHATWLVPPDDGGTPFSAIAQWNLAHPNEQMHLAYSYAEWPKLDRLGNADILLFQRRNPRIAGNRLATWREKARDHPRPGSHRPLGRYGAEPANQRILERPGRFTCVVSLANVKPDAFAIGAV